MISLSRPLKFLYATMLMLAGACLKTTLLSAQTTFKEKELHQYHLDTWGEREGLSTSAIIDIAQDQEGYLWISTHRGLLRFDGYRFVLFNKFSEESFQTSGMRVFLRDKKGNFFVSSNGSGIYIYQKGKFVPYAEKKGLGDPHVYDIFEDSRGRFWAGTKEGVYVLEPEETVFKPVFVETEVRKIIAQVIREDAHGKIWFGTEEGLFFLNQKGLIERFLKQDRQNILAVTTMLLDQQRTFWIGSYSEGLYQWLPDEPFPKKYPLTLSVKHVNQLYQNDYGVYFIASDEGLYRFFDNQLSQITTRNGLIHNNVNAIYQDKEGSLWFGSYYGGFHRLKNARFHTLSITEKLPNNTIHALYEENDSTVWVCTGEGLACLVHEKVVENSLLKKLKSALPNLKLRDMLKDTQGNYWIASYDGLLRYDSRKNKVSIIGINNGLKNAQIRVLLEDKNHQLWVGTRGGLHRLDLNGTVLNAFTLSDGLQSDLITDLLEDEKGIIWISTTSGIHIWNPSSEKIVPLFTKDGREKNTNFRMYLDAEGLLWVGSIYGLWVLKEGKIYYFSQANPLLSNTVFQVLEDEERNFWLTTEIGILKVERRALL
ncbi:MAG: hypothetical protein NZ521_05750, partial [Flammeovirgaceae bacterium]|nr:hypothetical protein [Flammeovirgaceae bacterium]MDW8287739.1 two-component regulator propeller domain-containing protein [Flammeovirgaceae bacterium]